MSKPSLRICRVGRPIARAVPVAPTPRRLTRTEPRVDTYVAADGTAYFAVSLSPNVARGRKPSACDVVILFDTSASQTSVYRDKALARRCRRYLAGLRRGDRVQLMAVDLEAVPLTDGFVAPQSDEMEQAVAALKRRAPLGATDMPARAGGRRRQRSARSRPAREL